MNWLKKWSEMNVKLKEEAKQLISELAPIFEEKSQNDEKKEKIKANLKYGVLKRLSDENDTLTIDEMLNLTGLKPDDDVIDAFKRVKKGKEIAVFHDIIDVAHREYLHYQATKISHKIDFDRKKLKYTKLSTQVIDKEWSIIRSSVDRDRETYLNKVHQFKQVKNAFSQFVRHVNDRLEKVKKQAKAEIAKTKAPTDELEDCVYIYEGLENNVLKLLKQLMIPEGCYLVMTWLSPVEWKKKFDVEKLNYDFTKSEIEVTDENHLDYMRYSYQKPLDEFSKDIQKEPVLEIYWKSVEQFNTKLKQLDKKTRNHMMVLDMIKHSNSKKKNHGFKYTTKSKLKRKIVLMKDKFENYSQTQITNDKLDFKGIKSIIHTDTLMKIKSMAFDIYSAIGYPYWEVASPYDIIQSLFIELYQVLNIIDTIPPNSWEKTDKILQSIAQRRMKRQETTMLKCNAIKYVQHEANKMYDLPPKNNRVQKLLPYRSQIPEQNPPEKPKRLILNEGQRFYLKCFTYLDPADIKDNDVTKIPEFKLHSLVFSESKNRSFFGKSKSSVAIANI